MLHARLLFFLAAISPASTLIEKAKALYADLQYEECLHTLADAEQHEPTEPLRVELELTRGLCLFQLRRTDEARLSFARARELSETAGLPSFAPPGARALFRQVEPDRNRAPDPIPHASPGTDQPASEETNTHQLLPQQRAPGSTGYVTDAPGTKVAHTRSRWLGRVLFGAPALASTAAAVSLFARAHQLAADARAEAYQSPHLELAAGARLHQTLSGAFFGLSAALLVGLVLNELVDF